MVNKFWKGSPFRAPRRARHLRAPATPAEALRGGCAAMASRRNASGISVQLVAEPEQAARRLWVAQAGWADKGALPLAVALP